MRNILTRLAKSPALSFFCGLVLLGTALWETIRTLEEAAVGAHHGLLVYGLMHIVRVMPEFMHGTRELDEVLSND